MLPQVVLITVHNDDTENQQHEEVPPRENYGKCQLWVLACVSASRTLFLISLLPLRFHAEKSHAGSRSGETVQVGWDDIDASISLESSLFMTTSCLPGQNQSIFSVSYLLLRAKNKGCLDARSFVFMHREIFNDCGTERATRQHFALYPDLFHANIILD